MTTAASFAIVCDSGCDLSPSFLEERGVSCVDLSSEPPMPSAFAGAYRDLARRGVTSVVSVHSAKGLDVAEEMAREAAEEVRDLIDVRVLDTGLLSLATGVVIERLSAYRDEGAELDEAIAAAASFATTVRLLLIPSNSSWLSRHRGDGGRARGLRRLTSSLRVRLSGERGLLLVSHGSVTHLARDTEIVELTSRLAHALSAVYAAYGPLVYVKLEAEDPRGMRSLEKSLDTNEFESRCLGKARVSPATERMLGEAMLGVVVVPESSFDAPDRVAPEGAVQGEESISALQQGGSHGQG